MSIGTKKISNVALRCPSNNWCCTDNAARGNDATRYMCRLISLFVRLRENTPTEKHTKTTQDREITDKNTHTQKNIQLFLLQAAQTIKRTSIKSTQNTKFLYIKKNAYIDTPEHTGFLRDGGAVNHSHAERHMRSV